MDATELVYELDRIAAHVPPEHHDEARRQVDGARRELEALEGRMREAIRRIERYVPTTTEGER